MRGAVLHGLVVAAIVFVAMVALSLAGLAVHEVGETYGAMWGLIVLAFFAAAFTGCVVAVATYDERRR